MLTPHSSSRASALTGLYVHNHEGYNNSTAWPFDKQSLAYSFGHAGYTTALIRKMHFMDAQRHGFDYDVDFNDWFSYSRNLMNSCLTADLYVAHPRRATV